MNYDYLSRFNMNLNVKEREKKLISKKSNGLGLFIFAYFATMNITSILLEIILIICKPNDFLGDSIESVPLYLLSIFVSIFAAFIPGVLYLFISRTKISDVIPTNYVKLTEFIPIIFIGMGVSMVANYAADIVANNFSIFGLENTIDFSESTNNLGEIVLSVIATAIVPAFAEEFAFRGILMGTLRKHGDLFAIIASAVIFGAMHSNIIQIPFAFILGLILGFITCNTNSIFPAITIHFVNNFYAVIMNILQTSDILSDKKLYIINYALCIGFCIMGLLSFVYIILKNDSFFKLLSKKQTINQNCSSLTFKDKILVFFINPGIIISLSLFLLTTITTLTIQ